jgi:hypothetical protein
LPIYFQAIMESEAHMNEATHPYLPLPQVTAQAVLDAQLHSLVDVALSLGVSLKSLSGLLGNALRERLAAPVAAGHATSDEGLSALLEAEGGCVDVAAARLLFRKPHGVTRQAVSLQIRSGKLLAYRSGGGDYLLPIWQFRPEGGVWEGLPEVLAAVREHLDAESPLTAFAFLLQAHPLTGGRPPLVALREGRLAEVLAAVEADAR